MRRVKLILVSLLLASCSAIPRDVDTVLDTTPEPAAVGASIVAQLELSKPVVVLDEPLFETGLLGATWNLEDHYLILLDPRLEPMAKTMVLIHELGHVLAWEKGSWDMGHGVEWGEAYAEVFRLSVGEDSP